MVICGGGQLPDISGVVKPGLLVTPGAPRCELDGFKCITAMPALMLSILIKSLVEIRAREPSTGPDP